jgi:hypothetical protein
MNGVDSLSPRDITDIREERGGGLVAPIEVS